VNERPKKRIRIIFNDTDKSTVTATIL
jgi:hypothetical protein